MQKPKVVVVMPAYNAQHTIEKTWREVVAHDIVDLVIVVDDASQDDTARLARGLERVMVHVHPKNLGYGGNQKTCYQLALDQGADIVVMVHPDYQYTPKLIPAMASMVGSGLYACVLGSRILGGGALVGGMPMWRYVANRFLTLVRQHPARHQGVRVPHRLPRLLARTARGAAARRQLKRLRVRQPGAGGGGVAGLSDRRSVVPDKLRARRSSITFMRSVRYGFGCLGTAAQFRLAKWGLFKSDRFPVDKHLAYSTWRQRAN